jgi:2-polyprenyl-6-methoxyphenol hydroxylase-like FAD-dependent oxidoreductase
VLLPARAGRTYPGHAIVVPRARFDAHLPQCAARSTLGRSRSVRSVVASVDGAARPCSRGRREPSRPDFVIGADGATSTTAHPPALSMRIACCGEFVGARYIPADVVSCP